MSSEPGLSAGHFEIDREGVWRHDGQEVTHPGVRQNLYANLREEGGAHYLQVGPARIPVGVEDAPFVVTRLEADPGRTPPALRIHLTDGSVESVTPEDLWLGARQTPYCRVKEGRLRARLSVAAWLQLAAFVEEAPGGQGAWLVFGGRRVPLGRDQV